MQELSSLNLFFRRCMNIAFYISNPLLNGGAERVVANLANTFAKDNNVTIITPFRVDTEYHIDSKIARFYLDENNNHGAVLRALTRVYRLHRYLITNKCQILFAFLDGAVEYAVLSTRFSHVKVIVSERNDPSQYYKTWWQKIWIRTIYNAADAAVFQTPDAQRWFGQSIQRRSKIIYNPVRDEFYNVERCPIPNRIVTCGRYEPQKNHHMLIDAMAIAIKRYPALKLSIYGTGELKDSLQDHIHQAGLEDSIILEGNVQDVPAVLKTAEIFVLSSDFEGAPNALMEAMAMGVPTISTDCPCGGPKMLLGDNENGVLVPVADAQSMADAIYKLHTDTNLQQIYSERSSLFAEKFKISNVIYDWKSIINIAMK